MPKINFSTKLISTIIIIGALPVVAGLFITYYLGRVEIRKTIGSNLDGLAEQVANNIGLRLEKELNQLEDISKSNNIQKIIEIWDREGKVLPYASAYLNNILNYNKDYAFVSLFDKHGMMITSSHNYIDISEISSKDQSRYLNLKNPFVSGFYFWEKGNEFIFYIMYPVKYGSSDEGTMRIAYKRDFFKTAIEYIRFGETGHAMLVDSNGKILICPLLPTGQHITDKYFLDAISKSDTKGWVVAKNDAHGGENSIVGFAPVHLINHTRTDMTDIEGNSFPSWYSFVWQSPVESYRPITVLMKYVLTSGFFLIAVISIIGVIISRKLLSPFNILSKGVDIIGRGNLDYHIDIKTNDEFEQLATEFNKMVDRLKEGYLKVQQLAILEEREWVSREIHDLVAQNLAYLKIQLKIFNDSFKEYSEYERKNEIEGMRQIVQETYDDVREIISGFRTKIALSEQFVPSLKEYLEKFSLRTDINMNILIDEEKLILPSHIEVFILRIIQEGLSNIRKHSSAKDTEVELRNVNDNISIRISDNGVGFDVAKTTSSKRHVGLDIMRERVEKLEGRLEVTSTLGKGTRLDITIPIKV